MDDFFIGLVICAFVLLAVAAPVLALIAFIRSRRQRQELATLRRQVLGLMDEVALLRKVRPAPAAEVSPAAPPLAAAPPPIAAALASEALAPPINPVPVAPVPVHTGPITTVPEPSVAPAPLPALLPIPSPASEPARTPAAPSGPRWAPTPGLLERAKKRLTGVDWERWIGVRGAAVVGGGVLALAAIFFFRHAFLQGWISPTARVVCGILAGLGSIAGAWRLRGKAYVWAPSAIEGAGVVMLYAAIWAADKRYALISSAASFPLMALVTALACALSLRHGSMLSALIGLAGGFATPLLLSTGQDRPFSLFGYLLVLDLGLLLLARRRRWPSIGLLALVGTGVYQGLWVVARMDGRHALGLSILGLFALLFLAASSLAPAGERKRWAGTQVLSILVPLGLAFHFAGRVDLGPHIWPTAFLLGLLTAASFPVARQQERPWLATGTALAGVAVVTLWLVELGRPIEAELWELAAVAAGLALVPHVFAELERLRRPDDRGWRVAAATAHASWLVLVVLTAAGRRSEGFSPLFLGTLVLAAVGARQALLLGRESLVVPGALALGLALGFTHAGYANRIDATLPDPWLFWVVVALLGLAYLALLPRLAPVIARGARHGAAVLMVASAPVAWAVSSWGSGLDAPQYALESPWLLAAAGAVLGALVLVAAARLEASLWVLGSVFVTTLLGWWTAYLALERESPASEETLERALAALVVGPAMLVVLASSLSGLRARRWAWLPLFLLGVLLYVPVRALHDRRFGEGFDAAAGLVLMAPYALAALRLERAGAPARARGWLEAAAVLLAAAGVADQFDHEEFVVTVALSALGLAWSARRLTLRVPAWGAGLLAIVAAFTLLGESFDYYHLARTDAELWNWISYGYLVPALALGGAAWCLRGLELAPRALVSAALRGLPALGLLATLFLWINAAIANHYAAGDFLVVWGRHEPKQDLTHSLAWGLYAGALLVLGTARALPALRWASLAVFFLALGKVFLFDLDHLEGLYRVASLAGLALSLIAVSLFYQRFVFRRVEASGAPAA